MKKHKLLSYNACFFLLVSAVCSCRKNPVILSEPADPAYVRVFNAFNVNLTTTSLNYNSPVFYLYLNSNFDSASAVPLTGVNIADPDLHNRPFNRTDGVVPYAVYYNDSYYSFASRKLGGYPGTDQNGRTYLNYYPNYTNLVPVAPIESGFDFYKWAQVPQGECRITITNQRLPAGNYPHPLADNAGKLVDSVINIAKGKLYSFFLTRTRPTPTTTPITNPDAGNFELRLLEEKPSAVHFNDSLCYFRFLNLTQPNTDADYNGDIDAYLSVRGIDMNPQTGGTLRKYILLPDTFIGTVKAGFDEDAPFYPLPYLNRSIFYRDDKPRLDNELPNFLFTFYKKGESKAAGHNPLWVMKTWYGSQNAEIANIFQQIWRNEDRWPATTRSGGSLHYPYTFDPLGGVHPTYNTLLFGTNQITTTVGLGILRYVWEPANSEQGFRR